MLLATAVIGLSSHAQVQSQENFSEILNKIQDSDWEGQFSLRVVAQDCSGPLKVHFFPAQVEPFSNGAMTVSYRHHADFSGPQNVDRVCALAAGFSPVDVGQCDSIFPKKLDIENGVLAAVPYRTIVPNANGTQASVSSPACSKGADGGIVVQREAIPMKRAELSPDGKTLKLTLTIPLPGILGFLSPDVIYELHHK